MWRIDMLLLRSCAAGVVVLIIATATIRVVTTVCPGLTHTGVLLQPTPWQSIGGCGAGGGSVGGGSRAMWVGKGVRGGLLDAELRVNSSVTTAPGGGMALLNFFTVPFTLSFHPRPLDIMLGMPLRWQSRTESRNQTGGIGDLSLTLGKRIGMSGQANVLLGFTLPTGKSDIHDFYHALAVADLQNGSGVFGLNLAFDFTRDTEWGMIILGSSYATGLFHLETTQALWDHELQRAQPTARELTYSRTGPFGYTNDMEVERGDVLDVHAYIGVKGETVTHSVGLASGIPLSNGSYVAFSRVADYTTDFDLTVFADKDAVLDSLHRIVNYQGNLEFPQPNDTLQYEVHPADTEWVVVQKVKREQKQWWTLRASYGMEVASHRLPFPLFFALTLPVEFNLDDGVGLTGFTVELGIKHRIF